MIIYKCSNSNCRRSWSGNEVIIKKTLSELELQRKTLLVCPKCNKTTFEIEIKSDNAEVILE